MAELETVLQGISVNAHSSVRIEAAGKIVYVDPFALNTEPRDADLIFITHDHFDHFSPEDIARVSRADTSFVLPETSAAKTAAVTGDRPVITVRPGEGGEAAGIPFETVPAYNPNKPFHPRANAWVGYVLELDGVRVYVAGDTDATPEAAAVRCDIALLPIGGKYTMDPEQAAGLVNLLKPQAVIPFHSGSVAGSPKDFDRFAALVDPAIRVCRKV